MLCGGAVKNDRCFQNERCRFWRYEMQQLEVQGRLSVHHYHCRPPRHRFNAWQCGFYGKKGCHEGPSGGLRWETTHWSSGFSITVPASEWCNLNRRKTTKQLTQCNISNHKKHVHFLKKWKHAWHKKKRFILLVSSRPSICFALQAEQHRSVRGVMTNLPTFPMYSSVDALQMLVAKCPIKATLQMLIPSHLQSHPISKLRRHSRWPSRRS